ncbi:hypothetical protein POM88_020227 [Heracleum sosnowskyi]|uniref:Uncharacterized protein n=1 Tax=Heracleum sosnowskyi TaxID=360622 RepID=A0AAD8IB00_9APIA|nr:hypothetical protein POM88_020227 [Heracleum sosnowskyi]
MTQRMQIDFRNKTELEKLFALPKEAFLRSNFLALGARFVGLTQMLYENHYPSKILERILCLNKLPSRTLPGSPLPTHNTKRRSSSLCPKTTVSILAVRCPWFMPPINMKAPRF